jgi:hypothetical protein
MYVCVWGCMYVCGGVCMCVGIYVCLWGCMHVCGDVWMFVGMYICMCVSVHIYRHTHGRKATGSMKGNQEGERKLRARKTRSAKFKARKRARKRQHETVLPGVQKRKRETPKKRVPSSP